jgi:recombination protein U
MIRRSINRQHLAIKQTSPRFVGKVGGDGSARGRLVGQGELDFVGHYSGRYVTFDAKATLLKRLPLNSLRRHQVTIVRNRTTEGAVAFFLVEIRDDNGDPQYLCLTWPVLEPYWNAADMGGAQSIPLSDLQAKCLEVKRKGPCIDLAAAIEALMKDGAARNA